MGIENASLGLCCYATIQFHAIIIMLQYVFSFYVNVFHERSLELEYHSLNISQSKSTSESEDVLFEII